MRQILICLLTLLFSSSPALEKNVEIWRSPLAAKTVAPRALTEADLGIKGALQELKGTFAVKDGVANVRVDMIRGDIQNPFQIIKNLSETAKAQGATTLRIEATLANEELYNILVKRYGLVTEGSKDIITIPLK